MNLAVNTHRLPVPHVSRVECAGMAMRERCRTGERSGACQGSALKIVSRVRSPFFTDINDIAHARRSGPISRQGSSVRDIEMLDVQVAPGASVGAIPRSGRAEDGRPGRTFAGSTATT